MKGGSRRSIHPCHPITSGETDGNEAAKVSRLCARRMLYYFPLQAVKFEVHGLFHGCCLSIVIILEKHRQAYREQQQGRTVCVSAWESSAYGSMHEPKLHVDASEGGRNNDVSLDFLEEKPDPSEALFDYASLRGADYRDLTHEEAMRMRDAYQQKLLLDRRVRWLKARALPDPERDAAAVIRAQEPQVCWNVHAGDTETALGRCFSGFCRDSEPLELYLEPSYAVSTSRLLALPLAPSQVSQ